jgi:thiosulfate/3-mercaptopyruvate sulfurtransferase
MYLIIGLVIFSLFVLVGAFLIYKKISYSLRPTFEHPVHQYPNNDILIGPEELHSLIENDDASKLILISVASIFEYYTGHIPGSKRIWRPQYQLKVTSNNPLDGILLAQKEFESFAQELGINDDSTVVFYDYKYDATRLWWAFDYFGKNVKILNGGFNAWVDSGYKTQILGTSPWRPRGNFVAQAPRPGHLASMKEVYLYIEGQDDKFQLWDTRELDEFSGQSLKKGAFRKGRIPKANFFSWKKVLDNKTKQFLPPTQLEAVLKEQLVDKNKKHIFYCQSGVRTTQVMLAFRLLGVPWEQVLNYDGSWVEWSYHKDNPIEIDI